MSYFTGRNCAARRGGVWILELGTTGEVLDEHFIGEGRGDLYPSTVAQVQGQWLPWLSA